MNNKLKITNLVMGLEKDFQYQVKYNEELVLQNKELVDKQEEMEKKMKNAIDNARSYCMLWIGTTIMLSVAILWIANPNKFNTINTIEENDNVEEISWSSTRLQIKWSQPKIYCGNSFLRIYQGFSKNR